MPSMTTVLHHVRRLAFQPGGGAPTDGQLLERFLDQRDETAFEELLRRHGSMVLGVCRRLLGSGPDAEDAFQATFLVLVRKAAAIMPREMVGNWLYGVAHRTALEARTLVARRRARETPMDPLHEPAAPAENVWHELRPLLDQEVSRLPQKYRAPVVLCDLEGKTQKEAARQLGWPEGTVSGRLFRARSLLAQRLRRHGLVLSAGSLAGLLTEHATAAAMPPVLIESTIQAAGVFAGGSAAAAGIVSAQVTTLAQGVIKTMWISQFKLITAVVLTVSVVGGGTGVLTQQALTGEPGAQTASASQDADQREQARQRSSEDGRRPEGPTLLPPGILERLDLTSDQKEKIAKLEKEFQEKIAPAKKKFDDAIEQARQNQDRQKAQEAQEAFRKEVTPIHAAFGKKVGQLLTEDQRRRVDELSRRQRGGPPFDLARLLGQLDLTAEQKEKVEKWMKEVGEKHEAAKKKLDEAVEQAKQNQDREKVRELIQAHEKEMAKLHEELLGKVEGLLSEEQKRKFAEVQRRRPEGGPQGVGHILPPPLQDRLGLTPEQKEKVAKLQKDTEAKLKEILNDEQNKKLEELKKGVVPPERPRQSE